MTLRNIGGMITTSRKQHASLLLLALLLSIVLLSGCGNQQDTPQGVAQLENQTKNTPSTKENVIEPSSETVVTSPEDVNIKIYKDKGDAVNAFYTAAENNKPIFLYFYTDT